MAIIYNGGITISPFNVKYAEPADVRTVVENIDDLKDSELLSIIYEGIVVYVVEDKSLYVCHTLPDPPELDNVEDGWKKISAASASEPIEDKVGIDIAPEGGFGLKIEENKGVTVEDYINVENYIKAKHSYTSRGVNSFESYPEFKYESVKLSKGGDAYIELYTTGDNWMKIIDPDGLGLSVTVDGADYTSGDFISKETSVCFGADIQFTDGWIISCGDEEQRDFVAEDYDLIDIYRSGDVYSPNVYAYYNDVDVRLLTDDDRSEIEDQIQYISDSLMFDIDDIDMGGYDSDSDIVSEKVSLQQVIKNINNSINKLEGGNEPIDISDIENLFS